MTSYKIADHFVNKEIKSNLIGRESFCGVVDTYLEKWSIINGIKKLKSNI